MTLTYTVYLTKKYTEGKHFVKAINLLQVDIFGIQELNFNTSYPHIYHDAISTFKINDQQAKIQMSTSPELFLAKYMPSDTLTGMPSKLKGCIDNIDQMTWEDGAESR